MKTLVCAAPGELVYGTAVMPEPAPGYAIIKIKRIGICGTDIHAFEGTQPFFSYPRRLGHELSGVLIDAGNAEGFEAGEDVTFIPYFNCGSCISCRSGTPNCCVNLKVGGVHVDGGMCEYLSVPSASLIHGNGLTLDELALLEPLAIGAHGVRRAGIAAGNWVLVVGAGPIGLAALDFAKIAGAKTIAMDVNESRLLFCKEQMGVDEVINAALPDVMDQLMSYTDGDMPAVVIDATGNLSAINNAFRYMSFGGKYVLIGLQKEEVHFSHPEFHKREGTLMSSRNALRQDFDHVIDALKKGLINTSNYITVRVPFDEAKAALENSHKTRNEIVKTMIFID
jgi:2-desacetyl-2-hydroxyethyl bacteriochlorophyllide A dehydrogenase